MHPPFVRVLNRGTQYVNYSKERKIRSEIELDSVDGKPLQVRWSMKTKTILNEFIPISMGSSQT